MRHKTHDDVSDSVGAVTLLLDRNGW
jgi:hypothetical protein